MRASTQIRSAVTILFVLTGACFVTKSAAAQEQFNESRDVKDGSTRVKGSGVVTLLPNGSLKADVNVNVRKSGATGVGKGCLSLVLFDENLEPFKVLNAGCTVGADALRGTADKDSSQSITLFPAIASKVCAAQLIPDTSDDKGYPTSLPDLLKKVGDINKELKDAGLPTLKDLRVGQTVTLGNTVIKKLK